MPLYALNRKNVKELAKQSGFSVDYLMAKLIQGTAAGRAVFIRLPLPKHLR